MLIGTHTSGVTTRAIVDDFEALTHVAGGCGLVDHQIWFEESGKGEQYRELKANVSDVCKMFDGVLNFR